MFEWLQAILHYPQRARELESRCRALEDTVRAQYKENQGLAFKNKALTDNTKYAMRETDTAKLETSRTIAQRDLAVSEAITAINGIPGMARMNKTDRGAVIAAVKRIAEQPQEAEA